MHVVLQLSELNTRMMQLERIIPEQREAQIDKVLSTLHSFTSRVLYAAAMFLEMCYGADF